MADRKIYTMGHSAVIVDMNQVELTLPEEFYQVAQNANHDPIAGHGGAVRKRPGLKQFNHLNAGGPVLGGIPMSVPGTGGAPIPPITISTVDGSTGIAIGSPPGNVPGPGSPVPIPGSLPGGPTTLFGSGLFNNNRLIVIGRADSNDTLNQQFGNSWYVTDANMADVAIIEPTGGAGPVVQTLAGPPGGTQLGFGGIETITSAVMTIANGNIYYPTGSGTYASNSLPIVRKITPNGKIDLPAFTIPNNPLVMAISPVPGRFVAVNAMLTEFGNGDAMYVAVADVVGDGAQAGSYGRVLRVTGLDSGNYAITEIFNSLNTNANAALNGTAAQPTVPYALGNYLGGIWLGTWRGASGLANGPTIAELQVDTTQPDGWKQSNVLILATAKAADVGCMSSIAFNGKMYIGYIFRGAGVTFATLYSYSGSPAAMGLELTGGNGGAIGPAASPNVLLSMVVFRRKLYASYWNDSTVAYIYALDPVPNTWSI